MLFVVCLCSGTAVKTLGFKLLCLLLPAAAALTWTLPQQIRVFAGCTTQPFSTEQIVQDRKLGIETELSIQLIFKTKENVFTVYCIPVLWFIVLHQQE